jgi:predicted metal-dependent hydrolase
MIMIKEKTGTNEARTGNAGEVLELTAGEFKAWVRATAEEIGVKVKEIHLRSLKRKLASCSSRGRLTFDRGILGREPGERKKIVVHELLHLRYPRHGRMFKLMLGIYLAPGSPPIKEEHSSLRSQLE